ncbi:hypothetical protein [Neobacillus driksii]
MAIANNRIVSVDEKSYKYQNFI